MRLSEYLDPENAVGFTKQTLGRLADAGEAVGEGIYDVMMDPGKMVGALTEMHPMDTAALVTAPVPVLGDLTEGANLMRREYNDYESDNPAAWEYGLAAVPGGLASIAGGVRKVGKFDERFDGFGKPRKGEQSRLSELEVGVEPRNIDVPEVSLADLEGKPFITTMSDRTAAGGMLNSVNDVPLKTPTNLQGGQDHMFDFDQVWASAPKPVNDIHGLAGDIKRATGEDPVLMPWRMAPTGGDFASMTGETMLAYAASALNKTNKRKLDSMAKKLIPDWKGVDDPESLIQFRKSSFRVRKSLKNLMDIRLRNKGGLSIGEARLAVADPKQLDAPDGGIQNVGRIDSGSPVIKDSGHASYPRGVPGEGIGRLSDADDLTIFDLLGPKVRAPSNKVGSPINHADRRKLQLKPYAGRITDKLLKELGY